MPITKSAQKALRVSKRKNVINSKIRSQIKTSLEKAKKTPTASNVNQAFSSLDTAVKKNLMHQNTAGRLKSQMSRVATQSGK